MEKGSAPCEKEGGSTRRKGELEARRLETALRRLFLGEPRLWLIGVERAVLGEETDLRTEGTDGAGEAVREALDLAGEGIKENRAGFATTSLVVRVFLLGEFGSAFSQSSSSKISGSRWRLPIEGVALGFSGHAKEEELDDKAGTPSSVDSSYHSACS